MIQMYLIVDMIVDSNSAHNPQCLLLK